jgi:hypothetical protein
MATDATDDGYAHFKKFNDKLNILCKLISMTSSTGQDMIVSTIFGKEDGSSGAKGQIDDKRNNKEMTAVLISKTFTFDNTQSYTSTTTELKVNNHNQIMTIKISQDVKQTDNKPIDIANGWYTDSDYDLFKVHTDKETYNIVDLNYVKLELNFSPYITTLLKGTDTKYVWQTRNDMLELFNRPVLLLTFDMYYYNKNKKQLFQKNFEMEPDATTGDTDFSVYSLLYMDKFDHTKRPTFLMLLMYYAGYSFNITKEQIVAKFGNKFYNKKSSFEINLYTQFDYKSETAYNKLLKSDIKPTSVDLEVEGLLVYHVGGKITSLWDYVNGKLTILINNMLSYGTDKDRYKDMLMKEYTSNSLFLFECIRELQKYKEYISNPVNFATIAYPLSTLKTLEILILKLSYILNVLEPTFIPIETMSFDVIIDGKKLKYVINSELQATNISIEDHISTNELMIAILSTREIALADPFTRENAIAKAKALISHKDEILIYSKYWKKELTHYEYLEERRNIEKIKVEKNLEAYKKVEDARKSAVVKLGTTTESDKEYQICHLIVLQYTLLKAQSSFRLTNITKKKAAAQYILTAIETWSPNGETVVGVGDNIKKLIEGYSAIKVPPDPTVENEDTDVKAATTALEEFKTKTKTILGGSSKNTTKKVNRK